MENWEKLIKIKMALMIMEFTKLTASGLRRLNLSVIQKKISFLIHANPQWLLVGSSQRVWLKLIIYRQVLVTTTVTQFQSIRKDYKKIIDVIHDKQ